MLLMGLQSFEWPVTTVSVLEKGCSGITEMRHVCFDSSAREPIRVRKGFSNGLRIRIGSHG